MITRTEHAALIIFERNSHRMAGASVIAAHHPFRNGFCGAAELQVQVLQPLVDKGWLRYAMSKGKGTYGITTAGAEALLNYAEPERLMGEKVPGQLLSRMTGTWSPPRDHWPVAAARGHHPHIASRGIG